MRAPLIAGNWKMHKTIPEAVDFVRKLSSLLQGVVSTRVWLIPPCTALYASAQAAEGSPVKIGAQNLYSSEEGAFTGEISARMIRDAGASFVLIGHSERRQIFHEGSVEIREKVKRALYSGLIPLLCIGETAAERKKDHTRPVLTKQIEEALQGMSAEELSDLVIAYEPVWAIGTGETATPALAEQTHQWIREILGQIFGVFFAEKMTLLYGGSVKADNIAELMKEPSIDGVLVGGASLQLNTFVQMIQLGKKG